MPRISFPPACAFFREKCSHKNDDRPPSEGSGGQGIGVYVQARPVSSCSKVSLCVIGVGLAKRSNQKLFTRVPSSMCGSDTEINTRACWILCASYVLHRSSALYVLRSIEGVTIRPQVIGRVYLDSTNDAGWFASASIRFSELLNEYRMYNSLLQAQIRWCIYIQ